MNDPTNREEPSAETGPYVHSRSWDLAAGLPLILFNAVAVAEFAILIARHLHPLLDFATAMQILAEGGSFVFFALQALLVSIRRLPLGKLTGLAPRLIALLAAYSPFVIPFLLSPAGASIVLDSVSSALLLTGTTGSVVALIFLGRSFAILPQARSLVVSGPYRFCRHPLYLFEQISLLGASLQFVQPWGLAVAAASFLLQFPRMRYEEQVLADTFPDYAAYRAKTAMLIPGLI